MLILFSLLTLASCSREEGEAPIGMKNAASEIADFYFYVPDDWKVTTGEKDLMASARISESDPSNMTMIGFEDGQNEYETVDSFWSYYKDELENRIFDRVTDEESGEKVSSFKLLNEGEELIIDGKVAKKYEYSGKVAGSDFSYMQVIVQRENIFYLITFTSSSELYSHSKETVEAILTYIDFK